MLRLYCIWFAEEIEEDEGRKNEET
jgi:hypothetical protein